MNRNSCNKLQGTIGPSLFINSILIIFPSRSIPTSPFPKNQETPLSLSTLIPPIFSVTKQKYHFSQFDKAHHKLIILTIFINLISYFQAAHRLFSTKKDDRKKWNFIHNFYSIWYCSVSKEWWWVCLRDKGFWWSRINRTDLNIIDFLNMSEKGEERNEFDETPTSVKVGEKVIEGCVDMIT